MRERDLNIDVRGRRGCARVADREGKGCLPTARVDRIRDETRPEVGRRGTRPGIRGRRRIGGQAARLLGTGIPVAVRAATPGRGHCVTQIGTEGGAGEGRVGNKGQGRGHTGREVLQDPGRPLRLAFKRVIAAIVDAVRPIARGAHVGEPVVQEILHPDVRCIDPIDRIAVRHVDPPGDPIPAIDRLTGGGNDLRLGHLDVRDADVEVEDPYRGGIRIATRVLVVGPRQ